MSTFQEKYGSIYLMSDNGEPIYEVTEPAVVFDGSPNMPEFVLHKIGNRPQLLEYFNKATGRLLSAGLEDMVEHIYLLYLPKEPDVLNGIMNNISYLRKYVEERQDRKDHSL